MKIRGNEPLFGLKLRVYVKMSELHETGGAWQIVVRNNITD